jgi:hypothetical protein
MPIDFVEKIARSQDSYFKTEYKKSGETSINLSNAIHEFLGEPDDNEVEFIIFKEDYVKALGIIINMLPMYISTSKKSEKVIYQNALYELYSQDINNKFSNEVSATYKIRIQKRSSDGRIYMYNLTDERDFNIRKFLIQEHSKLVFSKDNQERYILRLHTSSDGFPQDTAYHTYVPIKDYILEQKIFFGTPGSGKSWTIKRQYEMRKEGDKYIEDEEKKKRVIRTTFHPDTDYASFVGCYKPAKDKEDEKKIVYEFVPQAFTDAYVAAWSDLEHPYYLIIEEINRGNCAQIFGDLFQLLDRNKDGYSEYPIKADHDLKDYLVEKLPEDSEGIRDGRLCLPPNLSIIASMNTSDQSLFPMDSAFKRRWSWEYVPIDYENAGSGEFTITIGNEFHNWHKFLEKVNEKIKSVTSSEDKQMGNFFIKGSVDEKEFCDKVMFYLWSEIGRDNYQTKEAIFKYYVGEEKEPKEFSFNELYDQTKRTDILKGFIRYIEEEK